MNEQKERKQDAVMYMKILIFVYIYFFESNSINQLEALFSERNISAY